MIIGLSHIGLTVTQMDNSLEYYQRILNCKILNDSERIGDWIDKITGIPGFHTRTVYLAVTSYKHLEFFQFYNPKALPPDKEQDFRVGIRYCAFTKKDIGSLPKLQDGSKKKTSFEQMGDFEEGVYQKHRMIPIQDPDGLSLRIIGLENEETRNPNASETKLLYPALIVKNIESSLMFYQGILGLEITDQGDSLTERGTVSQGEFRRQSRSVVLKGQTGPCLKLIEPRNVYIEPARPWQMERVGFTHVAFSVRNLDDYYLDLTKSGVSFKSPPQSVTVGPHKGGKVVYFSTPDGITLEFIDSPLSRESLSKSKE
jgi:glyoxylase I family protein